MKKILLLIFLISFCLPEKTKIKFMFHPNRQLIKRLSSDPLVPRLSIGYNFSRKEILANIGGGVTMMEVNGKIIYQLGIQAGVFTVIRAQKPSFPIQSIDYFGSATMDWKVYKKNIFRLKFTHRSGHLSDEVNDANKNKIGFSRDYFSVMTYFLVNRFFDNYIELSAYANMHPKVKPLMAIYGVEIRDKEKSVSPYFGANIRFEQEFVFEPSINILVGITYGARGMVKTVLEFYSGRSLAGEHYRRRDNHFNINVIY